MEKKPFGIPISVLTWLISLTIAGFTFVMQLSGRVETEIKLREEQNNTCSKAVSELKNDNTSAHDKIEQKLDRLIAITARDRK